MKNYRIAVIDDQKHIFSGHINLGGTNPSGEHISFTNYFMEKDGTPFFGICGEFHYSRYDERYWEDEIIKMKMGGVNIVATYIFWNLHEEVEGVFEWGGNKNLRRFIELCGKHDVYVIIRIGPFDHGEIRNGGLPDWLFGRPFEVRSNDEGYLAYARTLYNEIGHQVQGLLFKDGGPIIGTQIENEHNHSSAQWGLTVGINNMWLNGGSDGNEHMLKLKEMALEAGIDTPIYTCTGWGGATTPVPDMLPLWGGYAYWPWIYYEEDRFAGVKEHPATPEYIFRDKHNNDIPKSYNFEPFYKPEDYPYACCEMGGGMTQFYKYRFEFPYKSVPAMTVMKAAEGCNLLGYYMYHGGTNPKGKVNPYTNDLATPKMSYDFDALIGEFGQVRESYKRTKLQHYFFAGFQSLFSATKTILPGDTSRMDPYDVDTLRYAVRAHEGAGFLFLNNFQDHVDNHDLNDFNVSIDLPEETIAIPSQGDLTLGSESFAILPFNFDLDGIKLKYATAQLVTKIDVEGEAYYFFFIPQGMKGEYAMLSGNLVSAEVDKGSVEHSEGMTVIRVDHEGASLIRLVSAEGKKIAIYTMTDDQSLDFWKVDVRGRERVILTNANLLISGDVIKLESTDQENVKLSVFPDFESSPGEVSGGELVDVAEEGLFTTYGLRAPKKEIAFGYTKVKNERAVLEFETGAFDGIKEALLRIDYCGDIGYAFIDGELINDNFCNDTTWEIGLKRFEERLVAKGMYVYVSPIRRGTVVNSNTTMAGWSESAKESIADIVSVSAVPVYEIVIQA
ncbi:glycosyl hydrolase family 35 [Cohnella endophytica]|uniref:Glycosyl hydrolase family 35 n=1 Tax=Cohnella endophytica TaxID=2419778 RepID=A0A494Y5L0_9BACL|nr:beta-galactosidase [Cohnella endophytica]RKP57360.1 glycosyl hydrolase family 35 [Cohnella endophytica]